MNEWKHKGKGKRSLYYISYLCRKNENRMFGVYNDNMQNEHSMHVPHHLKRCDRL